MPRDVDTAAWRGNSFKRAIARIGDQINSLMDSFANDDTVPPLPPALPPAPTPNTNPQP